MEKSVKFRGVCAGLSMDTRVFTYSGGKSWYPLSQRLKAAREFAGFDYSDMAVMLGCHRTSVMRWEREHIHSIENRVITRWAQVTGVTPDWIVNGGQSGDVERDALAVKLGTRYVYGSMMVGG